MNMVKNEKGSKETNALARIGRRICVISSQGDIEKSPTKSTSGLALDAFQTSSASIKRLSVNSVHDKG